jgi:glucose/mannose-6-phosphate isomerase
MIDLDNLRPADLGKADPAAMHAMIAGLPKQCVAAMAITEQNDSAIAAKPYRSILICGMGGSAIGGDLLAAYLQDKTDCPVIVNRNYGLPRWAGPSELVIVSSYSGDTEETLSGLDEAERRGSAIAAITSGGALLRRCRERGYPCVEIPGGLPPRGALGYSFFGILGLLLRSALIKDCREEVVETIRLLESLAQEYAPAAPAAGNRTKSLAQQLHGCLPVVYASVDSLAGAARRWANQFNENAKVLSYWALFPELCHNEIVGWEKLPELRQRTRVVFLQDQADHPRNALRMRTVKELLDPQCPGLLTVSSRGVSPLARLFSLIYLGDWTSLYLAYLNGADPTPVTRIAELKTRLQEAR